MSSEVERQRWSRYDDLMDSKWVRQMMSTDQVGERLDKSQAKRIDEMRELLENSGLYHNAKRGTWSEKSLIDRAAYVDDKLKADISIFSLIYKLAVKQGDAYIHSSPKALAEQVLPILPQSDPSRNRLLATARALAVACTGCYGLTNFIRLHYGMEKHALADRFGSEVNIVYAETASIPA